MVNQVLPKMYVFEKTNTLLWGISKTPEMGISKQNSRKHIFPNRKNNCIARITNKNMKLWIYIIYSLNIIE